MKNIKNLRWWIIILVAIITIINYIDRGALSIMWPEISKELGMTKEEYSFIAILFTIAYAVSQSVSGKIYDWIGTRLGFVMSVVIWSVSEALHAMARGVLSFSVVRFFLGFGEAGNWPGATKSNAEWFPVKERALAQGIFNSGASIGSIISPPLIAFLYLWVGWKITFIILGVLGILWLVPWLIINKALPAKHPWITEEEKEYILSDQREENMGNDYNPSWLEIMKQKESWSVLASRFFLDPIWWLFVFWLPIYLADKFGFNIKQIGLFAWVPYVGAASGAIFGGWIAGFWMKRGWELNKARKAAIVLGGLIMLPSLLLTALAATPIIAVLLIALILFGFQVAIGNIQTLPSDFFTGKSVGSLAGAGGTTAAIGVILTTYVVPLITRESYTPFFVMGALLVPLGILSVFVFSGKIRKVDFKHK